MVPMLTCGLVRSNFAFATGVLLWSGSVRLASSAPGDLCWGAGDRVTRRAPPGTRTVCGGMPRMPALSLMACATPRRVPLLALGLRDDLLGDVPRNLGVGVELH